MPAVSVVIPSHNYGHLVRQAVSSVLMQTHEDLECIVVDDGSTDDTQDVLARIPDPRLRVVRHKQNLGVSAARNTGLDNARGAFLAFLDADDLWSPHYLQRQVALMRAEPDVGISFADAWRSDIKYGFFPKTYLDWMPELWQPPHRPARHGEGYVYEADAFCSLVRFQIFPYQLDTKLIRSEVVNGERPIRFPVGVRYGQDKHFLLRCYMRTKVGFIPEPLAEQRRHPTNSTKRPHRAVDVPILSSLLHESMTKTQRRALLERIGQAHRAEGYRAVHRRALGSAFASYAKSLQYPRRRVAALGRMAALPFLPWLAKCFD